MFGGRARSEQAVSPVVAVVLLVLVTVLLTVSVAPIVFEGVTTTERAPYGAEITFKEAENGSVFVSYVDVGTADKIYLQTEYYTRTLTDTGDTARTHPGEGSITVIASRDGENVTAQTYTPQYDPDELLLPKAAASEVTIPPGSLHTFDASNSKGDITTYAWDFNEDGTTDATGQTASHSFSNPGVYNVSLTVTNDDGRTASTIIRVVAAHVVVANDGSGDYATIQNGVDAVSSGASVYVKDTNTPYSEYVSVTTSGITVFSDSYAVLNGDTLAGSTAGFAVTADDVTVRGLHITEFDQNHGLVVAGQQVTIEDVYLSRSGDAGDSEAAMDVRPGATNVVINNTRVVSNHACGVRLGDDGSDFGGPDDLTLSNSRVSGNEGHGVCIFDTPVGIDITNSDLSFNNKSAVYVGDADEVRVTDSVLVKNSAGASTDVGAIELDYGDSITIARNRISKNWHTGIDAANDNNNVSITDNTITGNHHHGVHLVKADQIDILSNVITRNDGSGLEAESGTHHVEVRDSNLSANGYHGIYFKKADNITLESLNVTNNGQAGSYDGIRVDVPSGTTVWDVTIRYAKLYNNSNTDVYVQSNSQEIDARKNWWGQTSGPNAGQTSGPVNTTDYCTVPDCSDQKP